MKILRLPEVKAEMGHRSDASIYNAIRSGLFPFGVQIGQRAKGWPDYEVTYSYAPTCKGDLLVTIHVVLPRGETVSFQAQGRPENVMALIAKKMVQHFQRTSFPTLVAMGDRFIVLVGAPGTSINIAPTPKIAEEACSAIKARLPTEKEYEFLSILGDWNGGISLDHKMWAMAGGHVMSPDTRNPSPVRHPEDVNYQEVNFFCVR